MSIETKQSSTAFDPSEPLLTFLRGVLGASVRYAEPPATFGLGFDTMIYGFRIEGPDVRDVWARPLVLRVYTTPQQDAKARAEAAVQRFAYERGYPVLPPLVVETSDGLLGLPFMIIERMPGGNMLERFTKRPWQGPRLFREMGRLHGELHRLAADDAPLPRGEDSVDMFARTLRVMAAASKIEGRDDELAWLDDNAAAARGEAPVLVHGDFHPLNILIDAAGAYRVIDWSDASIGSRHADVARTTSLMWFAKIVATSAVERIGLTLIRGRLQRWYLAGYRGVLPLEPKRLAYWEAAQALRGLVQIAEVHTHVGEEGGDLARRLPPELIDQARAYVRVKVREFEALP